MIIGRLKDKKEILKMLEGSKKIFIMGCSECATTCKSGGEEEVRKIGEFLIKNDKEVVGKFVSEPPCIEAKAKLSIVKNRKEIKEADTILVLACGLGVQVVDVSLREKKKVISGTDTLFAGAVFGKAQKFVEFCSLCGECLLDKTSAICPYTRCSKGLLNGPCGGSKDGKCEVDREKDCAWILIYKKLKEQGQEAKLLEIIPPKDFSKKIKPFTLEL